MRAYAVRPFDNEALLKLRLHRASSASIFEALIGKANIKLMFELRAKSKKETDIMMYGSISEYGRVRAEDFIAKLVEAKSKGYEKVNLKINSPGGSIFEGIAIMAQMQTEEVHVTGIVEGVAASMACVMLQGCHNRAMVEGARLMVHQGSGGVIGSANYIRDYADLLDSLNKTLADIYAKKTKKDAKWILANWMKEGKDTWFTAQEALKAGLVDEIIPGKVKALEKAEASLMEMAAHYASQLETESKMNKEELIKLLGLKAEATEAEIMASLTAMKIKAEGTGPAPAKPEAPAATTEAQKLVDSVVAIAKSKGVTDEKKVKAIEKLAAVDVQAALDLIGEEKPADKTETTVDINKLLGNLGKNGGSATDTSKWDWKEWNKLENAKAFGELLQKEPKKYIELFKAEFNYEPSEAELKGLKF